MVGWSVYVTGNWRPALGIVAIAPFLMFWGFGRVSLPATAATRLEPDRRGESLPVLYWTYWVALALAVAVEFCMIFWSADYLQHALGMAQANAAQAVSLFLIGMIAGRVAGSRIVPRIPINKFVTLSILVAGIGFMIYWQAGSLLSGLGSLFVTGLGVGSLYPLILSLAIGAAGDKTVRASGRATLASGTAILILPLVLGRLADAVGIRLALGVVMVALAGVLFIILITARLTPLGQPVIES
jgi:fucose permease